METKLGWWLPPNYSTHGASIDSMMNLIHWFMAVLFVGWAIYLVYVLFRFRARSGHKADVSHRHFKIPVYIEVGVVVVEVFLLVFLSSPIWFRYKNDPPPEKDSLVVNIVAEQFAWNIHYPGRDGIFGPTKLELIDGTNPVGLDRNDPTAKDDIVSINGFHVPVGKPVIVHLRSKDVIHGFNLPFMRVKQDIIPGMTIPIWFQATAPMQGEIACAQLCGNSHYRMRGQFFVDTPEDFEKFMNEERASLGLGNAG